MNCEIFDDPFDASVWISVSNFSKTLSIQTIQNSNNFVQTGAFLSLDIFCSFAVVYLGIDIWHRIFALHSN